MDIFSDLAQLPSLIAAIPAIKRDIEQLGKDAHPALLIFADLFNDAKITGLTDQQASKHAIVNISNNPFFK